MKRNIYYLILLFGLLSGTINGQVLDVTFNTSYITGKSWVIWELLYPQGTTPGHADYGLLPEGFGIIAPNYSNGIKTPMYVAADNKLTMGAPENAQTPAGEDTWFTYTATGLTVGRTYNVYATIVQFQGWAGVSYALGAWSGARPADGYVVANSQTTSPATDFILTGVYIASETTMTFGIGAGKDAIYFHKTQIKEWRIEEATGEAGKEANIGKFTIDGQVGNTIINPVAHTVTVTMPFDTDVTALMPAITLSPGATSDPVAGIAQNFTLPVVYTVTSQDLSVEQEWTVTVSTQIPGSANNIISNSEFDIAPGAKVGVTVNDTLITAGDIILFSYEIGQVKFTQNSEGKLSGANSGYVEIVHQGWAPGYIRFETSKMNFNKGTYEIFFAYDCGSDKVAITPAIVGTAGVESPLWSDTGVGFITGKGTYSNEFTLASNASSVSFMLFLGYQSATNNSGTSFYIDALILKPKESVGVADKTNSNVAIYPNPTSDNVNIDLTQLDKPVPIQIYNIAGVEVYSNDNAIGLIQINNLITGLYFVKVDDMVYKLTVR